MSVEQAGQTATSSPPATPVSPSSRLGRLRPRPQVAVALAYVAAMFLAAVDMQIINVVLPTLSRDFGEPLSAVQWTALAYLLTLAVVIPASGWIGDRVGVKRTFVFAIALFTVASAVCGAVDSLGELIAARAIQGVGGGLMTTAGTAMLYRTFPPQQRARLARTVILPILIGPGSAPILGGALTDWLSWRWIFFINVPVGVAMALFSWFFLPRTPAEHHERLDVGGLLLSGIGLAAVLYAVSEGSALGWGSWPVLVSGIAGILSLTAFTRRCLRHRDPILRIRLLSNRLFRATNIVFALSTGPFLGSLYLTPILLQTVLHQSPLASGLTTFTEAIGVGIGSQTLARLYPHVGPKVLTAFGSAGLAIYLGLFLFVDAHTNLWLIRGLLVFGGFANSATFLAAQTAMFATIAPADLGHASAIYTTQRQSTIALNVAVMTTIAAGTGTASIAAFHTAYLVAALLAVAGVALALALIRTRDAQATMRARAAAVPAE